MKQREEQTVELSGAEEDSVLFSDSAPCLSPTHFILSYIYILWLPVDRCIQFCVSYTKFNNLLQIHFRPVTAWQGSALRVHYKKRISFGFQGLESIFL